MLSLIGSEFDELLDSIFLDLTTCLTYMDMSFKIKFLFLKKIFIFLFIIITYLKITDIALKKVFYML
jgi:hypothetical protein